MLTARGEPMDRIVGLETRRRRLPAQALRAARAAGAREGAAAPRRARRRRRRGAALRPAGDRPRRAPGAAGRPGLRPHQPPVRPARGAGAEPRPRALARPDHGRAQGPPAGGLRPQHRRAHLAHPRRHRGRPQDAPARAHRARRRLRVRDASRTPSERLQPRRCAERADAMRSLYLRIYLTVVAALALFALVSGWLVQQPPRAGARSASRPARSERAGGLGRTAAALAARRRRAARPSRPRRCATGRSGCACRWRWTTPRASASARPSPSCAARADGGPAAPRLQPMRLDDGRTLWVMRPAAALRRPASRPAPAAARRERAARPGCRLRGRPAGPAALGLVVAAGGAVRGRGRRRLAGGAPADAPARGAEAGRRGLRRRRAAPARGRGRPRRGGGAGRQLQPAAARIEALLRSHQSLLANASHELRSPLARLKMAVAMLDDAPPAQRDALQQRDRHQHRRARRAGRGGAAGEPARRRARRWTRASRWTCWRWRPRRRRASGARGAGRRRCRCRATNGCCAARCATCSRTRAATAASEVERAACSARRAAAVELRVCDRGPGVPEAYRERIFEPFFRLPGHAEREGGVGLGLALVRQIAERHGGSVRCEPREGGGSCFVLQPAGGRRSSHGCSRGCRRWRRQHPGQQQPAGASAASDAGPAVDANQKPGAPAQRRPACRRPGRRPARSRRPGPRPTARRRRSPSARWRCGRRAARRRPSSAPRRRRGTAPPRPAAAAPRR